MAGALMTVTTGASGLAAAAATAGLRVTVGVGDIPEPALIAILVAAVVMLAIEPVPNFEYQSRHRRSRFMRPANPWGVVPHWHFHGDDYWTTS